MRRQELKAVKDRSSETKFELAKHLTKDFQNYWDTNKNIELERLLYLKNVNWNCTAESFLQMKVGFFSIFITVNVAMQLNVFC